MSLTCKVTFSSHVETRGIVTHSLKSTSICLGNPNDGILSILVKKIIHLLKKYHSLNYKSTRGPFQNRKYGFLVDYICSNQVQNYFWNTKDLRKHLVKAHHCFLSKRISRIHNFHPVKTQYRLSPNPCLNCSMATKFDKTT